LILSELVVMIRKERKGEVIVGLPIKLPILIDFIIRKERRGDGIR
jgi:hypothetical protein